MRKTEFILVLSLIAALSWMLGSCKDDITGSSDIVFPDSNVSYGRYVEPLFIRTCAYSPCHSAESASDDLILETYQDAVSSKPGVVIPRDTANSRLIWRVEGTHGVIRMPFDRPPLSANQIRGLRRWILEGAQNN